MKEKLEKESSEKEKYRIAVDQQRLDLSRHYESEKAETITRLTKELNAKIEEKNEIILAEQDRKAQEDNEKRRRDEQIQSQHMQQESVQQMQKELMEAIQK